MNAMKNIGASVRARLLNRARADKADFNLMLTRYALERLLYRLSVSAWSDEFLLKGALLFDLWFDQPQRPTRDIDLLGFGHAELAHLTKVFQEICGLPCEDGIAFDQASLRAAEIRRIQTTRACASPFCPHWTARVVPSRSMWVTVMLEFHNLSTSHAKVCIVLHLQFIDFITRAAACRAACQRVICVGVGRGDGTLNHGILMGEFYGHPLIRIRVRSPCV